MAESEIPVQAAWAPDPLLLATWADELRAMAALGLLYTTDLYDRERYERLQRIAAAMLGVATGESADAVQAALAGEMGYVTVKVGVAAAVFNEAGRLLLVQRQDNRLWAMPGGWADVGDTPAAMAAREVREETGLTVRVHRLLGLYDSRFRQFRHPHHLYHVVFLCVPLAGEPVVTPETADVRWFGPQELPSLSPGHEDPVRDAFQAWADPQLPAIFD